MRVAALYDIHGNLPAFEAVLEAIRREPVDLVVVGGDVLPGPMPGETLSALQQLEFAAQFIQGNGDREVLAFRSGALPETVPLAYHPAMQWVAQQLTAEHVQFVASWRTTIRMDIPGLGDVLFCHATPRSDAELFTRLTSDTVLRPIFAACDARVVVCGHTHMQFERRLDGLRIINAGSVGMPFGAPGAHWLLLGPDVQFRHTPYDVLQAATRIRGTEYPQAEDFAANYVVHPPSEAQMLEAFMRPSLRSPRS
jgi:putative phosphoesterase